MELLNEGAGFISNSWAAAIRSYFSNAYSAVRGAAGQGIKVMIGDAFLGVSVRTFFTFDSADMLMIMIFRAGQTS